MTIAQDYDIYEQKHKPNKTYSTRGRDSSGILFLLVGAGFINSIMSGVELCGHLRHLME